jgi:adenylate cyclase
MATVRRLTAILAADVAGYSRLMGADEEGTHERLKAQLRELVDPKIGEHRGRVVKNTGDGFLAEFLSVVDAVRCAVEVQRGMAEANAATPPEQRIEFRVGINLGDVIAEEHDIFGDGVNIAARLEALAEPGGICVSRVVRDQIRDKLSYLFEDMGEQSVKNISRPVRVYALRPEAVAGRTSSSAPLARSVSQAAGAPRLSIVVLPFANLSSDPEQGYFADGITEDLTTDLSRIADMLVISRNTAVTYRNKPVDTKQIGRELSVRYVLEGSVRRSGNQVRVNAQLIDAETGAHLWAEPVRLHYGRSVRLTRRDHEVDRGRTQSGINRSRSCPAHRASASGGLHSAGTKCGRAEAPIARQLCRGGQVFRKRAGARSDVNRGGQFFGGYSCRPRARRNDWVRRR